MRDSEFFSLVEAGSGLRDRLSGKYFISVYSSSQNAKADHRYGTNKKDRERLFVPVRLRSRAQLPVWARELRKMLKTLAQAKISPHKRSLLWLICEPAMIYARKRLREQLTIEIRDQFSKAAGASLEGQLRDRMSQTAKSCFELQVNAFKTAYTFVKRSSDQKALRAFAKHPATNTLDLLENFPALARLWSQLITDWVSQVEELAKRLSRDRKVISKSLFAGRNAGRLIDVQLNLSDPHRGGREVVIFRFEHGRVVYKPREARGEYEWFELLNWMNREGFSAKFRIPRMVRRKTHSWMEFIPSEPCKSEAAARRFYRRAGAIALAAYLVRAIDCHRGNLIASGEHPVLIDLETIMHDEMVIGKKNFDAGILRTGLFPVPRNARLPRYDYAVFDQGGRGPHMPILNGRVLSAGKYAREIINGFREAWNLMLTNEGPRRSLRRRLRRLKIGRWRRLYWPTSNYIAIRDASISPAALRSGAARLRALVKRCTRQGVTSSITLQEIISLERFDVPRFSQSADAEPQLPSALEISDAVRQLRAALLHDC